MTPEQKREYNRQYRQKHHESLKAKDRERWAGRPPEWRMERRAALAWAQRAWRNGMTSEELTAFFDAHGWKCDICDRPAVREPGKRDGLVVDHNHECCGGQQPRIAVKDRPSRLCGQCARGLLCVACNAGIGQMADSVDRLKRAIEYIERVHLTK